MGASQSRSGCCCSKSSNRDVKYESQTVLTSYENGRLSKEIIPKDSFQNYISVVGKDNSDWEPFKNLLCQYFEAANDNHTQNVNLDSLNFMNDLNLSSEAKQVLEQQLSGLHLSKLSNMTNKMKKNNLPSNRTSNFNRTRIDNRPTATRESVSVSASVSSSKCPQELQRNVMKEKIKEKIMNDQTRILVNNFNLEIIEYFNIGSIKSNQKEIVVERICRVVKCFVRVMQKNIYSNTPFPAYISKSKHRLDLKAAVGGFMYEVMFEQNNLSTKTFIIDHLREKCRPQIQAIQQAILRKRDFALTENERIREQFPEFLLGNQELPYQEAVKMIADLRKCNDLSMKVEAFQSIVDQILNTANDYFKYNEKACLKLEQGWREPEIRTSVIAFCILESGNTDIIFDFEIMEMFIGIDQSEDFKASVHLLIEPSKEVVSL